MLKLACIHVPIELWLEFESCGINDDTKLFYLHFTWSYLLNVKLYGAVSKCILAKDFSNNC